MTQTQALRSLKRAHGRALEQLFKRAYREGYDAGIARAHGGECDVVNRPGRGATFWIRIPR